MAEEKDKQEEPQGEGAAPETGDRSQEEKPKRSRRKPKAEAAAETPKAEASEEKPKPRRRTKKVEAEEAKEEAAAEEAAAEEAEAEGEPEPEDEEARPKTTARRGGAAAAGSSRRAPKHAPDGDVTVRARAKYVRTAPRKARLVIDHIRGKDIPQARAILIHTPRAASRDVLKLLDSAIANAENNHDLVADDLKVGRAYVDEGPTLKRYRPRALGRATRIRKRTSHMTIELVAKE